MKKILSLCLVFVFCFVLLPRIPAKAATTRTENFVFTENFDSTGDGQMPAGWYVQMIEGGKTAGVSGGALVVDGTGSGTGRTLVRMPVAYRYTTDFVFEADFTISSAINGGRWGSLVFRMSEGDNPTYHQMAIRRDATIENGIEFATWPGTDWIVHKKASYSENVSASSTYRVKIEATGTHVKEYINGKLVMEVDDASYTQGGFGIGCAGAVVRIDNVKISGSMTVPMTEDGYYFKDDFSSHPAGGWVAGYRLGDCQPYATVGMIDGRMVIDSTNPNASATGLTTIFMPASLDCIQDFVLEADFTILAAKDASRWGSLIYRAVSNGKTGQGEIGKPYMQMAIRQNATAGNGVEYAIWNGGFSVPTANSWSETISADKTYHVKIMACGNRIVQYINGQKIIDYIGAPVHRGSFGVSTAGAKVAVDNVTIAPVKASDMPPAYVGGYTTNVYEPSTSIIVAPTTIWEADASLASVIDETRRPATVKAHVGADGMVRSMDQKTTFGTVAEFTQLLQGRAMPAYYVDSEEGAEAVSAFLKESAMVDVFVWSKKPALVDALRTKHTGVKGVVEFDSVTKLSDVMLTTNAAKAKICVIPQSYATKDNLMYLQKRFMTVWTATEDNAASVHTQINMGANGIITSNYLRVLDALESYTEKTMVRKANIIGHRGMPQGTLNENTLSSFRDAYNAAADMIELDIYLTTDNQLVVMHDDEIARTANGSGPVSSMTLAQAQGYTMRHNPGERIPSLRQVFQEYKGKDVVLVVEIKSNQAGLVAALKTLMDEFDIYDQVVTICFYPDQLIRMEQQMPGISRGYLNMVMPGNYAAHADLAQAYSQIVAGTWTCNQNFAGIPNNVFVEAAKHRGLTMWPWTYRNRGEFDQYYYLGCNGLTTDYAHWATNYETHLSLSVGGTVMKPGEYFSATTKVVRQNKITTTVNDCELVRLEGDLALSGGNGLYTAASEGTGTFCFRRRASLGSGQTYWLYSEAFTVECYESTRILSVTEKDGKNNATITTSAVSRENKDIPLQLLACVYDKDGRLVSVKTTQKTLIPGAVQNFVQEIALPNESDSVKLFVWREDSYKMLPFDTVGGRSPQK